MNKDTRTIGPEKVMHILFRMRPLDILTMLRNKHHQIVTHSPF